MYFLVNVVFKHDGAPLLQIFCVVSLFVFVPPLPQKKNELHQTFLYFWFVLIPSIHIHKKMYLCFLLKSNFGIELLSHLHWMAHFYWLRLHYLFQIQSGKRVLMTKTKHIFVFRQRMKWLVYFQVQKLCAICCKWIKVQYNSYCIKVIVEWIQSSKTMHATMSVFRSWFNQKSNSFWFFTFSSHSIS